MAKESITIKCYPPEEEINKTIKRYEAFGWELIGNQRFQEVEGLYINSLIATSYNLLTFSREQNEDWYEAIVELETQYNEIIEKRDKLNEEKPKMQPQSFSILEIAAFVLGGILGIPTLLVLGVFVGVGLVEYYWLFMPIGIIVICSIIFAVSEIAAKKKRKMREKAIEDWNLENGAKIEAFENQAETYIKKAIALKLNKQENVSKHI